MNHHQEHLTNLKECWKNSPFPSIKLTNYFDSYVEAFSHLVGKKCVFIETGILDGGSLFMWRDWRGPEAKIIGIDLNPAAKKWEEYGFEIYIGDQGDPLFWKDTFQKIGPFDALLDDGGHQSFQQINTCIESINHASKPCVIAIEDTATSLMKDFHQNKKYTFLEYSKAVTDMLLGKLIKNNLERFLPIKSHASMDEYESVYNIRFYSGVITFHVDKNKCMVPELIRNRGNIDGSIASDFRYEGKKSALIKWPSIFSKSVTRNLKGGQGAYKNSLKKLASMIPVNTKLKLKTIFKK